MNDKIYIPIEKISLKQYRKKLQEGYWGGIEDPKIIELIKDNSDNPYINEE